MDTSSPFALIPSSREKRWHLMREVISDWYPPLTADDGYANPVGPVELPAALREWYQLCGKRSDIWSRQDKWYPPWEADVRDHHLAIYAENQGCAWWGIPVAELSKDDPSVFVNLSLVDLSGEGGWVRENATTSEFALQMLASSIKWSEQSFWANGSANESVIELVRKNYPRFSFPNWNWPAMPTQFYGSRDLIVEINGEKDRIWLWVVGRTEIAFKDFNRLVKPTGIQWEAESPAI